MYPLITIGISVFNGETSIQRAVLSALKQTYTNLEIIVVDDGSTDRTWDLLSSLNDTRLRCLRFSQNKGIGAVRNAIIEESKGEYIAFFDADDISHLNRIEGQYNSLSSYQESTSDNLIVSLCSFNHIGLNGKSTFIQIPGFEKDLIGQDYALNEIGLIASSSIGTFLSKHLLNIHNPFYFKGTSILMSPKTNYQKIGCYDDFFRRCEDTDWNIRFGLAGGKCIGTQNALVDYYTTFASYKKNAICNYYFYHLFKKHQTSFSNIDFYNHITESFKFNQKCYERDFSSIKALLSHPFNWITLPGFIISYLRSKR